MIVSPEYATYKDLQALSLVFLDVLTAIPYYNALAKQTEEKKYTPDALHQKLQDDPYSIILLKENDKIAAFCYSRFDDFTIWLEWFGVAASYQGRHFSDLLLRKLEDAAKVRGCHKIWCDSRTENTKSIHLLSKHGYEKIAFLQNHWYTQDFYLWQKFLPAANVL